MAIILVRSIACGSDSHCVAVFVAAHRNLNELRGDLVVLFEGSVYYGLLVQGVLRGKGSLLIEELKKPCVR